MDPQLKSSHVLGIWTVLAYVLGGLLTIVAAVVGVYLTYRLNQPPRNPVQEPPARSEPSTPTAPETTARRPSLTLQSKVFHQVVNAKNGMKRSGNITEVIADPG